MVIKMISYLLVITGFSYWEVRNMKKDNQIKEVITYLMIIGIASIIYVCYLLKLPIPNPLDAIKLIFEPIGLLIDQFLGGGVS
ncbi:hypothetical protein [Metabacillus litoralis]|uniref:hypothetical protein n=1 Tax=Metabacillus litoralis TaxID=152268 RepID=UPI001CFD8EA2|nr:hypothetical protein [Metabacillus litoralis]